MSDKRLTELSELATVADDDYLYIVDSSDTTDSAQGTSKYAQAKNVRGVPQTAAETAAGVTPTDYSYPEGDIRRYTNITDAIAVANAGDIKISLYDDQTVTIPTNAATLQIALDSLVMVTPNKKITLQIETGHALTAGFRVEDGDFSSFVITSVDATVSVSASMTLVSNTDLDSDVPRSAAIGFLAINATMPEWQILVDMTNRTTCVTGYELDYCSNGLIRSTYGITDTTDSGSNGSNVRVTSGSRLQAAGAVFSDANLNGLEVTTASYVNFQGGTATGCGAANVDVSRGSTVHCKDATLTSGGQEGIYARRSFVSAQGVDVSSSVKGIWSSVGSVVGAQGAVFTSCTTDCQVDQGSTLDVSGATKSAAVLDPSDSDLTLSTGSTELPAFNRQFGGGIITNDDYNVSEVVTGTVTLVPWLDVSQLDSSGGAVTATLGGVDADMRGHIKTVVMTAGSTSSTLSVTNHETSDPEVFTFTAVDDTVVLLWTGSEWITLATSGATT